MAILNAKAKVKPLIHQSLVESVPFLAFNCRHVRIVFMRMKFTLHSTDPRGWAFSQFLYSVVKIQKEEQDY